MHLHHHRTTGRYPLGGAGVVELIAMHAHEGAAATATAAEQRGHSHHLSFPAGAVLTAQAGQEGNALWFGCYQQREGWFPPSYCRLLRLQAPLLPTTPRGSSPRAARRRSQSHNPNHTVLEYGDGDNNNCAGGAESVSAFFEPADPRRRASSLDDAVFESPAVRHLLEVYAGAGGGPTATTHPEGADRAGAKPYERADVDCALYHNHDDGTLSGGESSTQDISTSTAPGRRGSSIRRRDAPPPPPSALQQPSSPSVRDNERNTAPTTTTTAMISPLSASSHPRDHRAGSVFQPRFLDLVPLQQHQPPQRRDPAPPAVNTDQGILARRPRSWWFRGGSKRTQAASADGAVPPPPPPPPPRSSSPKPCFGGGVNQTASKRDHRHHHHHHNKIDPSLTDRPRPMDNIYITSIPSMPNLLVSSSGSSSSNNNILNDSFESIEELREEPPEPAEDLDRLGPGNGGTRTITEHAAAAATSTLPPPHQTMVQFTKQQQQQAHQDISELFDADDALEPEDSLEVWAAAYRRRLHKTHGNNNNNNDKYHGGNEVNVGGS